MLGLHVFSMKRIAWFCVVSALCSNALFAQRNHARVRVGDQVRFRLTPSAALPIGATDLQCEGQVFTLLRDTLVIRPHAFCGRASIAGMEVRQLQLEQRKGSRRGHVLKGALLGLVGGGIAGWLIVGDGCRISPCDGGLAVIEFTLAGIVSGGIIGSAVGFLLPAGVHWRSLTHAVLLDRR